ncbi:pyridine nucleotide-disulfide oxidoreductase [Caulobacter sp. Root655]|uniref:NAD(P)/FAD-dependent oxidoreductase n=1 Tax=Caulobacter sp. Root655 TaxID=1736578 RepID=UPI0006F489F7|nr:FAD-dependent oxidoreductase [Caulobacter sp. Root655]KRA60226.1 pyridine nucleotide-disulfide oxidoreductase [Caulobacter sp. Root655]
MHYDIVIVGGGAGGLELAARLGRKLGRQAGKERVLLIDRSSYHIWKPSLHEVAAGTLDVHQEGLSYSILGRSNHFSFLLGELDAFDPVAKRLTLKPILGEGGRVLVDERGVTFTWGVLAIGSGSNLFGTPGAEQAHLLERTEDAEAFHTRLLAAFMKASFSSEKTMSVAIVGGGATGVELSAELIEAHRELLDSIGAEQRFRLDIAIVEAAPRILGGLPEKISDQATVALERKGVRVRTGAKVSAVHADRLATSLGDVPADLIVWAAGVKAAATNTGYGLETNRTNQFVVNDRLETSAPDVWALGDCAGCPWIDKDGGTEGRLIPARAQAAHQQASYLAKTLIARLGQRRVETPFVYRDFGSLVSLGENKGVGALMGGLGGPNFFVEGLIAKWAYISLHLDHHRAILGTPKTVVLALARLLQQRVAGRLKLH